MSRSPIRVLVRREPGGGYRWRLMAYDEQTSSGTAPTWRKALKAGKTAKEGQSNVAYALDYLRTIADQATGIPAGRVTERPAKEPTRREHEATVNRRRAR